MAMRMVRRFGTDRSGATAMLFGLSLLPLMGAVGAAVDYSRAANFHSRAQLAVDGAALAIVREPATLTEAEIQAKGDAYVRAALGHAIDAPRGVTNADIRATRIGKIVKVDVGATMKTSIIQVLGISAMPIAASAQATWGNPDGAERLELALVLDNTGSMRETIGGKRKIDELKAAANNLVDKLRLQADRPDKIKLSIVPFDTEVRLDPATYRSQPWFRWSDPARDPGRWTGYVFDRYGSYAVSDAAPSAAIQDSLFPAPRESEFAANGQLAPLRPLGSLADAAETSAIKAVIDGMQPRGNTNIALGVNWGLATLSSGVPFTEGVAPGTAGTRKFMVVLTDGENTMNHVDGQKSYDVGRIDANTSGACTMAKAAKVEVYTIRLLSGNENLLRNCASSPGNYFDVQRAGELDAVLGAIFNAITSTRLTH